jgi:hypothetical protein
MFGIRAPIQIVQLEIQALTLQSVIIAVHSQQEAIAPSEVQAIVDAPAAVVCVLVVAVFVQAAAVEEVVAADEEDAVKIVFPNIFTQRINFYAHWPFLNKSKCLLWA